MDVLSSGEPEPSRDAAQTQAWPDELHELHVTDEELVAFETFDLPGEGEVDVEDAFGEHGIEYWVWDGNRLIPASPNKVARIHELEALDRLAWQKQRESEKPTTQNPFAVSAPVSLFATARHGAAAFAARLRGLAQRTRAGHAPEQDTWREPEHSLSREHRPSG